MTKCVTIIVMSVEDQIFKYMNKKSHKDNRVCFSPKHFINFAAYDAVKKALERLVKSEKIRRVTRGIYDIPYESELFGILPPDFSKIVEAIAYRDKVKVQPTGAQAANLLGLSEQVPGKVVYLTDGRAKKIKVGNATIYFKPTSPRNMNLADSLAGLIIQALKYIGKGNIDKIILNKVQRVIEENPKEEIKGNLGDAPIWIAELLRNKILKD